MEKLILTGLDLVGGGAVVSKLTAAPPRFSRALLLPESSQARCTPSRSTICHPRSSTPAGRRALQSEPSRHRRIRKTPGQAPLRAGPTSSEQINGNRCTDPQPIIPPRRSRAQLRLASPWNGFEDFCALLALIHYPEPITVST